MQTELKFSKQAQNSPVNPSIMSLLALLQNKYAVCIP